MKEIINRKSSISILSIIIILIVGVAYLIDDLCYRNEKELTLQIARSSMVYAQELISNKGEIFNLDKELYAGGLLLNNDSSIVDQVKEKTGFGCTIFLDSLRISTTATEYGSSKRALGTYANSEVIEKVYKNGDTFRGITNTIGKDWVIIYTPLKDIDQVVVGMLATYIELDEFIDSRFHFRLFSSLIFILLVALILIYSLLNRRLNRNLESKAKDEISLRNVELEGANKSLDSFVYRASHDLKAPIINIQSMLKILPSVIKIDNDSQGGEVVKNLNKSARDLKEIIGDLLEISRIDRKQDEQEVEVDLNVLVDDLIWNMKSQIDENEGEIITDFSECPKISAPPTMLRSVLINLINNAFNYRSPNRPPKVTVRSFTKNGKSHLSVSDNGVGMDLDKHGKKLFDMFSRLHPHLDVEGTGVGLHLVKKMLDSIEAKIELKSAIDQGTKFLIIFKN